MNPSLAPEERIYKYQLIRRVGSGNFGEVWLARDRALSRDIAVKILDESMAPVAASLDEARRGNRLAHQNVVKIHYADVVSHGGRKLVLIAMDHYERGSIVSMLNAAGFVPAPTTVRVMTDVLRGLEYLHDHHLLHNDIKPSNILLAADGTALLADYGLACTSPGNGPVAASNAYVLHRAPETTVTGNISVASDVYQAGMTLFRLLNGVHLLREHRSRIGIAEFERLKALGCVPAADDLQLFLDRGLKRVIDRATEPDPARRYQTALEMRRALERISNEGYWDVDDSGNYFGVANGNRFEVVERKEGDLYGMEALRQNTRSGRITRVTAHCHAGLSPESLRKKKSQFMVAVVKGDV